MSEWMDIKKEMPLTNIRVLCWVDCASCRKKEDHSHKLVALPYPINGIYIDQMMHWDGELTWSMGSPNVTHWKPLPAGPYDD